MNHAIVSDTHFFLPLSLSLLLSPMFLTLEVFHFEMSALNLLLGFSVYALNTDNIQERVESEIRKTRMANGA